MFQKLKSLLEAVGGLRKPYKASTCYLKTMNYIKTSFSSDLQTQRSLPIMVRYRYLLRAPYILLHKKVDKNTLISLGLYQCDCPLTKGAVKNLHILLMGPNFFKNTLLYLLYVSEAFLRISWYRYLALGRKSVFGLVPRRHFLVPAMRPTVLISIVFLKVPLNNQQIYIFSGKPLYQQYCTEIQPRQNFSLSIDFFIVSLWRFKFAVLDVATRPHILQHFR